MGIASGTYDRRLTIQVEGKTQTNTGQLTTAWTDLYSDIPARIKYESGNQGYENEQRVSSNTVLFEIRFANGIKPGMRVIYEGENYNIFYVAELGRRVALQLRCETKDNS